MEEQNHWWPCHHVCLFFLQKILPWSLCHIIVWVFLLGCLKCGLKTTDFILSTVKPFVSLGSRRIRLVKHTIVKYIHTKYVDFSLSLATKDITKIFKTLAFRLSIFWGVWWVNGRAVHPSVVELSRRVCLFCPSPLPSPLNRPHQYRLFQNPLQRK